MSLEFYVYLGAQSQFPAAFERSCTELTGGFLDGCTVWFAQRDKNEARKQYMNEAKRVTCALPSDLKLDAWPPSLLQQDWLALQVDFELLTPWYSKDDRVFHVLDNPVRKDRVFGVPFMSAASWKGMLRWACRMRAGLREHLEKGKRFEDWNDPPWILHLFGNEKGEERDFHQGALVFYPTWFDRIGFEVINPHSRERRAGTQPIYYEVVPPGAHGTLCLLYAPWLGMRPSADPKDFLPKLLEAIEMLLTAYGIPAERTVGWPTAEIQKWWAFRKGQEPVSSNSKDDLWTKIKDWFQGEAP
ncbi:hypothetical protein HRbin30_03142 [bacterium HR30]|nr:hypothetical protein HRbin30_03142 [bacterium HR30]